MFSCADLSLAEGKMRKNQLITGGFWYDFIELQAASCQHFVNIVALGTIRHRVFCSAGYLIQSGYMESGLAAKNVFCCLNRLKGRVFKGLSIDTTHIPPPPGYLRA
jgi:hypothetical protein